MVVDPVPRVIDAAEWEPLEAGLLQRARALNAFLLDAYGDQRIFEDGVVPRRLLETSQGYEPLMRGLLDPGVPPATVAGMDLIRDADGELLVLEDNLRMPSGATYAIAVREAVGPELGARGDRRAAPPRRLRRQRSARRSAPPPRPRTPPNRSPRSSPTAPKAAPTTSTSGSAANSRCRWSRRPSSPARAAACTPRSAASGSSSTSSTAGSTRTGSPTPAAASPRSASCSRRRCESGRLRCVNAIGTGLADDKLAHAYVEEMVRFYLGEEPLLRSVPSYDLSDPEARDEVMGRLDELVIKPRDGFGGHGVTIMPLATEGDRRKAIGLVRRRPERFVAQELVPLSTHPTVVGAGIAPRRVDLRPYVRQPRGAASRR